MKNISPQLLSVLQPARNGSFALFTERRIPVFARQRENIPSVPKPRASTLKKILVPLTLDGNSERTLALLRNLAATPGSKITLLHVVQLNIAGEERGIARARLLEDLRYAAELELRMLAALVGNDVETEVTVSAGRPADIIVKTAKQIQADTIVMCVHPHRRWLKWLHRETALNVARKAACDVVLVPATGAADFRPRVVYA
jgi:nucleotide-binding universal stress UspA family protein